MALTDIERGGAKLKVFTTIVSLFGLSVFAYSTYSLVEGPLDLEWALLFLVTIVLVSRIDIGIPKTSSVMTLSDTFLFISILLYGTHPSVLLAGVDAAICTLQFKSRRKIIWFNVGVMSLSVFVASTAVRFVLGDLRVFNSDLGRLFMAAGLLALVHYPLNTGLVSVVTAFRQRRSLVSTWKESFLWTSLTYFAGAAAACLIVKLISVISFYAFIIAVPVLTVTYFTYKIYLDKVDASNRHVEQMADLHLRTIEALAIAIDAKDEVTHDHVRRVQIYATGLARLFGLTEPEIEALRAGALLHDIGKLAVPDYILNKPGPLTAAEFDKMKVHTIVGADILERVGFPYPVVPVVRHHHERWDGRGYPDGLRGDQIPITARILTISDCFDAVREDRQYRKAMTREEAIAMLKAGSGGLFDPSVVSVFLDHLEEFETDVADQGVDRPSAAAMPLERRADSGALRDPGQQVFERIRSAHREVITLYNIAQMIGTSLDVRDTFAVFSSRLEDIVSYTTCVLYLLRPDTSQIEAAHVSGRHAERFKGRRMSTGAGITGWVVVNRHSMHNSDPRLDFDALKAEVPEPYTTATVVPLIKDDEVLGALALYSAELRAYEPDHLRLVEAVANLASDAIANAVHHEKTETTAVTDLLTDLPNARALRYRFEEELDRARRHNDTFTLVMMDLDGFKTVNDQMGHQAGDQLMREIGQFIIRLVRSSDFVSRYAGDEYVAILQAGPDEARESVQRIQTTIGTHDFGSAGSGLFIGISAGWACFPQDGDSLDELLLLADRAMYANKNKRKALLQENTSTPISDVGQYKIM